MDGEGIDYAIAFCKGVKEGQEAGKLNRKLLTPAKIKELLKIDLTEKQMPPSMLEVFKQENVYVRKLRGKDLFGVWWTETNMHGRGVSR